MRVARESAETRKILRKTLRGADPAVLRKFFENPFYYSDLRRYYHCEFDFLASDADSVQAETRMVLWKPLRGADPAVLNKFFEKPPFYSRLRFYYHCVSDFLASDADRVQGRKGRPMRKK